MLLCFYFCFFVCCCTNKKRIKQIFIFFMPNNCFSLRRLKSMHSDMWCWVKKRIYAAVVRGSSRFIKIPFFLKTPIHLITRKSSSLHLFFTPQMFVTNRLSTHCWELKKPLFVWDFFPKKVEATSQTVDNVKSNSIWFAPVRWIRWCLKTLRYLFRGTGRLGCSGSSLRCAQL